METLREKSSPKKMTRGTPKKASSWVLTGKIEKSIDSSHYAETVPRRTFRKKEKLCEELRVNPNAL